MSGRKIIPFNAQDRGRHLEKESAADKGANLVPASGAGGYHLLDFRTWRILWSKKTTTKDQSDSRTISIPVKDIDEARSAARSRGCMWAYEFEFNGRDYVLQEKPDWHEIAGSEEPELRINDESENKRLGRLARMRDSTGGIG